MTASYILNLVRVYYTHVELESPADTLDLVVINYPEMYLDVNRASFKKHIDFLFYL